MSLKRHLTEVVRPWLSANCHWALSDRRLLLGTPEDIADQQAQGELYPGLGKRPRRYVGSAGASVGDPARSDARHARQGQTVRHDRGAAD